MNSPPPVLWAAAAAIATAWTAQHHLAAAAALAALCVLAALHWRRCALLAALPALLANVTAPPPLATFEPGLVEVGGTVTGIDRLAGGDLRLHVRTAAGAVAMVVDHGRRYLPGDEVRSKALATGGPLPEQPCRLHGNSDSLRVVGSTWQFARPVQALRDRLRHNLAAAVGDEQAGLLLALVLGDTSELSADTRNAHRATGTSHLLAVSGAHAVMLAFLLGLMPFQGGVRPGLRPGHLSCGLVALGIYGAVVGLEPPVFRALVAFALAIAARLSGRRLGVGTALGTPLLLSAVFLPDSLTSPGLALSCAAVFGLSRAPTRRGGDRWQRWLIDPLRASAWASAATAPLCLFWFAQLAPWSVLWSPLLAPVVAALLCLGLLCALTAGALPWLGELLAAVLVPVCRGYCALLDVADRLPGTPILAWSSPGPLLLLAALLLAALVAWQLPRRGLPVALALLCVPWFLPAARPADAVHLFAVGHGQCLLATLDGRTIAVDCGSMSSRSLPVRKLLAALPSPHLDLLVLTHGDHDHWNGLTELLQRCRIARACLPDHPAMLGPARLLERAGVELLRLPPGARAEPLPGLQLARAAGAGGTANDEGLWVHLAVGDRTLLLAGDAEERGIRAAVQGGIARPADLLLLPHHGRPCRNLGLLFDTVQPQHCLCSNHAAEGRSAAGDLAAGRGMFTWATGQLGDLRLHGVPLRLHSSHAPRL